MAQRVKRLPAMRETWVGKIPWRRKWQPIPVFLPGESHGQRSLAGYSPRGRRESDTTERLSLSLPSHACVCLVAQSCTTLCNPMDCRPPISSAHGDSSGKNAGVACYALLQQIFPTQGSYPGHQLFSQILYCLSHQGSPRILEWLAYPFSKRVS